MPRDTSRDLPDAGAATPRRKDRERDPGLEAPLTQNAGCTPDPCANAGTKVRNAGSQAVPWTSRCGWIEGQGRKALAGEPGNAEAGSGDAPVTWARRRPMSMHRTLKLR